MAYEHAGSELTSYFLKGQSHSQKIFYFHKDIKTVNWIP